MNGLEALQSVQFISKRGKRFAVLTSEEWESLIDWLENVEDAQISRQAFAALKKAGGNRARAGWHRWDEVKGELG